MRLTDILSFCFSVLGLYGLVYCLRFLIPRNLLPYVSAILTEAEHLLVCAESTGVIPQSNEYRSALALYDVFVPSASANGRSHSPIITVTPINSCAFGWKAIALLEYYSNFGSLFDTV